MNKDDEFVTDVQSLLMGVAINRLGNRVLAEDLVQEAFVGLAKNFGQLTAELNNNPSFRPIAISILQRRIVDYIRKPKLNTEKLSEIAYIKQAELDYVGRSTAEPALSIRDLYDYAYREYGENGDALVRTYIKALIDGRERGKRGRNNSVAQAFRDAELDDKHGMDKAEHIIIEWIKPYQTG